MLCYAMLCYAMKAAKLWEAQGDSGQRERYLTKALLFLEVHLSGPQKREVEEVDDTVGCGTLLSAGGECVDRGPNRNLHSQPSLWLPAG